VLKLCGHPMALRACLGGLQLHQTNSGVATPPICSSTVELDSPIGAEEMCLAETTTPAPKNEDLNRLPSYALNFFCFAVHVCVRVLCACMCTCGRCVHAWCVGAVCVVCVSAVCMGVYGCVLCACVCMCGVCVSGVHACVVCVRVWRVLHFFLNFNKQLKILINTSPGLRVSDN
jgi:hypothetical protein